jgi:two-component sensor histidine kinase
MSNSPLHDDIGRFSGFLALVTDISDRKTAEGRLRKSLEEKEALLKELHHRVKNNLQIISSVLSMSAEKIPEGKYREYFSRAQERIISMALIHDQFYHSDDLGVINFKGYLGSLITHIEAYYSPEDYRIEVRREVEDVRLDLDKAVPLGLVVNELLINSFRHAFPQGEGGVIEATCIIRGKELVIRVSDNGVGVSQGDLGAASLGLMIVEALADQLRARISFDETDGLSAEVRVPLEG